MEAGVLPRFNFCFIKKNRERARGREREGGERAERKWEVPAFF